VITTELISQQEDKRKLPDGWRSVKLGDIADTCSGTTPSRDCDNYYQGSIPWVKTGELQDNVIYDSEEHISEAALRETSLKLLPVDTLLVAMYGQGKTRGRTGLLAIPATTNQACFAILPNPEEFDSHYLQWWFRHSYSRLRRETEGRGGNQPNLNGDVLRNQQLLLPPLDEQKRIAAILNEQMEAVERSRQATLAQLEAAKALPAAYLRAVFNTPEAQKWERKSLRELCKDDGQYGTSEQANDTGVGLPVLRMGNIFEGQLIWDNLRFIELPETEEKKYRLEKGDILFNRTNSAELVGKTAVFDGVHEAVFASYLIRFQVVKELVNPHYVAAYINSAAGRCFIEANMARAIGQVNISASTMHKMPIPVPPLSEQERIAATLTEQMAEVERLKQSLKSQLNGINKLPATLLRRAFNGEL
jgi:type I restriction enzyme S subunit